MNRSLSKILWLVLGYIAFSFYEPFWRLLVRGLAEGDDFAWNYAGVDGRGTSGDYWMIALITGFGLLLLHRGFRWAGRAFRWLALMWVALLLLSSLMIVIADPATKIEADTLHFTMPYALTVLPVDIVFFGLFLFWFIKNKGSSITITKWNPINILFLLIGLAMFPIEFYLLNAGSQDGIYDQLGVYATFVQWVAIIASLYPWSCKSKGRYHPNA